MAAADAEDLIGQSEQLEMVCDQTINPQKKKKKKKQHMADAEDLIGQSEQLETERDPSVDPEKKNTPLSDLVETFRGVSECEKHWESRREFISRNFSDYEDPRVDQLLALSMVWANRVFLGCRYNPALLKKVEEMAEGIVVEDAPVFKTRDELIKQQQQKR